MAGETILVVDDEENIVEIVSAYLKREGYQAVAAYDGEQALEAFHVHRPALVVLDIMLPKTAGWDVLRELRKESRAPVIMLTARDEDMDKILGLELGADDYVTKPFNPRELVARVRAVLRRAYAPLDSDERFIRAGDIVIDQERREVRRGEVLLSLTPTEFQLLCALAERPGRVLTRLQLLERAQEVAYEGYERTIDSHVKNLRRKLEPDPARPRYILTSYGVGYQFAPPPS